jgi:hypothetical protein
MARLYRGNCQPSRLSGRWRTNGGGQAVAVFAQRNLNLIGACNAHYSRYRTVCRYYAARVGREEQAVKPAIGVTHCQLRSARRHLLLHRAARRKRPVTTCRAGDSGSTLRHTVGAIIHYRLRCAACKR